jgi:glycosyltransferase involved in cell wall biosynthesis
VGAVPQRQLPDWYRAADLTVLSSHSEGIPNVLRESLACGTPFVATRVGGTSEVATHPSCRLVPPGNPSDLATAIIASLDDPRPDPENLSATGTWKQSAQRLLEVLRPLVLERRPTRSSSGNGFVGRRAPFVPEPESAAR